MSTQKSWILLEYWIRLLYKSNNRVHELNFKRKSNNDNKEKDIPINQNIVKWNWKKKVNKKT
jgi:hypothetical protein